MIASWCPEKKILLKAIASERGKAIRGREKTADQDGESVVHRKLLTNERASGQKERERDKEEKIESFKRTRGNRGSVPLYRASGKQGRRRDGKPEKEKNSAELRGENPVN